jgi:hypothetical protein
VPVQGCTLPLSLPFLLQAEWTAGLLNVNKKNRTAEIFLIHNRKSNSEPPVLWHNTSTKYVALTRKDIKYDMKDARDVAHIGQHINEGEVMVEQHKIIETKRKHFPSING